MITGLDDEKPAAKGIMRETSSLYPLGEDMISVKRDKVIDWIEADLWKRFEKRLWSIVTAFLVIISIAGLIGIPYYIRNETKHAFETQTALYEEEQRQFISLAKSFFKVSSDYLLYREAFRSDLSSALRDIRQFNRDNPDKDHFGFLNRPDGLIKKLLLEQNYAGLLNADFVKQALNSPINGRYSSLVLSRQEDIDLENRVLDAVGGTSAPHPFRRGDLAGFYSDLKMKIVILSAYEQALVGMQQEIFRVGGKTELSRQTQELEAETETTTVFVPLFDRYFAKDAIKLPLPITEAGGKPDEERARRLISYYVREAGIDPTRIGSIETIIPTLIDRHPCAHWRSPMDMMRHG